MHFIRVDKISETGTTTISIPMMIICYLCGWSNFEAFYCCNLRHCHRIKGVSTIILTIPLWWNFDAFVNTITNNHFENNYNRLIGYTPGMLSHCWILYKLFIYYFWVWEVQSLYADIYIPLKAILFFLREHICKEIYEKNFLKFTLVVHCGNCNR